MKSTGNKKLQTTQDRIVGSATDIARTGAGQVRAMEHRRRWKG